MMTIATSKNYLHARAIRQRAVLVGIAAIIVAGLAILIVGIFPRDAGAQTAPSLGGAESFAVLGGSTVTNTGTTNVYGDLGVNPGTAITGFLAIDSGPGVVHGAAYTGSDGEAVSARSGATAAYGSLASQGCSVPNGNLTGQDLGGLTLIDGVYCFDTSADMTGTLTLDGQGNPAAVFIIRTGTTLVTASGSSVNLINGASACNVFWQVGSSATLGTTTNFVGNLLATASITLNAGAAITGRALAGTGAVTMNNNIVDARPCSEPPTPAPATATAITAATSTAIAQATSTAIAAATLTPVPPATATAIAQATSTAIAAATLTPVAPATATAIAQATSTAIAAATLTPVAPATATAIAQATSTAIAAATLTPVAPATATAIAQATSTAIAAATLTPVAPATATAIAQATSTAIAAATLTPVAQATATAAARQTGTVAAPGAPSTGSGPRSGSASSLPYALAGAALLLLGAGGFVAASHRQSGRKRG